MKMSRCACLGGFLTAAALACAPAAAIEIAAPATATMPVEASVSPQGEAWHNRSDRARAKVRYRQGYRDGYRASAGQDDYYRGQPVGRNTRVWRGQDDRYYCRKDDGTTGLLIGAAVGGLVGNEIAGRGDKTLGTVLGAVGGALLGREIDRDEMRCR